MNILTPTPVTEAEDDIHPNQEPKFNVIFAWIDTTDGIIYSDQTGHFPCISIKGNKYIMILYCLNANVILCQTM